MTSPRIVIVDNSTAVASSAADVVEELILQKPSATLALPTGRTPIQLYQELARRTHLVRIDWSGVRVFNLDEWVGVSWSSEASYARFMAEHLFSQVNIPPAQCFIPNGMAADLERECQDYEAAIEAVGGIDLAILGLGRNGHIGFNEPGTPFKVKTHVATVTEETRAANAYSFPSGDPPRLALTVGIATILRSRWILLLVTGDDKAEILARSLAGPVDVGVPASILQRHPDVTIIADTSASVRLPRKALEV